MRKYSAEEILTARERRIEIYNLITKKYSMPFMVIRVNYPGREKNNELCNNIIQVINKILIYTFSDKIHCKAITYGAEGVLLYMVIDEDAYALKRAAIDIESRHILGRCVDIDVYNAQGDSIGRSDLGIGPRKCYLCDNAAHVCVRASRHSEEEVIQFIKNKYREYKENIHEML